MVGKILIAVLLGLFIAGVSLEANAKEVDEQRLTEDVVCATLGANAGNDYVAKTQYYMIAVKPYFKTHLEYLKAIVRQVHFDIGEQVQMDGSSIEAVSSKGFDKYCGRPFI